MPRKATGTVRILRNDQGELQWHAKWTKGKKSRTDWTPIPGSDEPPIALNDLKGAKAYAASMAGEIKSASANSGQGETLDEWARRHFQWRERQGNTTNADAGRKWREGTWGGRWGKWISSAIGSKSAAKLSRDDVESVRDRLNEAVRRYYVESPKAEGATSYKNAMHVWSCLTTACKQMVSAERDSALRVRPDNPARDVPPPRRPAGMKKAALRKRKHLLRPREFLTLVGCERLSTEWREAYCVLAYGYLRPGEARVLEWKNVDLSAGTIHIRAAWDFERNRVKRYPKGGASREVPIEPSLRPLLVRMRARARDESLVLPCMARIDLDNLSRTFRDRLQSAGVTRAELHERSATEKAMGFRQLRDFGITMRLWRGDNMLVVKRHAGHEDFDTMEGYVVEIERLGPADGVPFPPLPDCLVESPRKRPDDSGIKNIGKNKPKMRTEGGTRSRIEIAPEAAGNHAISLSAPGTESPRFETAADEARPLATVGAHVSDDELETAFARASLANQWDTATLLRSLIEERRRAQSPNVIPIDRAKK